MDVGGVGGDDGVRLAEVSINDVAYHNISYNFNLGNGISVCGVVESQCIEARLKFRMDKREFVAITTTCVCNCMELRREVANLLQTT